MIESWIGGTGRILPEAIRRSGHRYTFVTRKRQHYLGGVVASDSHAVLAHADNVLTLETNDVPRLVDDLRDLHRVLRFDGVMTICDYYLETVRTVADALGLPSPFPSTVADLRHKHLVRESLDRAGMPNPAYGVTTSWDATRNAARAIGYPLVIKPTDLASSAYVTLVRDERELQRAYDAQAAFPLNFREQARDPLYLLEEYMEGEEFSVEACAVAGDTTVIGITDKSVTAAPHFVEDGHMFPAAIDPATADELTAFALRALRAVGHDHGPSHTEIKLTAGGPRLIEINPRLPGNYIAELISYVTGIDLLQTTIELAVGRQPDLRPAATDVRSAAIKFVVPPHGGRIAAVRGADALDRDPAVVRWQLDSLGGFDVSRPIDNACYIGHVVAVDRTGPQARAAADRAVDDLDLVYDGATARPPAAEVACSSPRP